MSIRLRLTLWYTGLLAMTLVTFGVIFYVTLARGLLAEVDKTLRRASMEVHRALGASSGNFVFEHVNVTRLDALPMDEFAAPGVYVQIMDERGYVTAASSNLRGSQLPVDLALIETGLTGHESLATLAAGGGERVRVHTTPILVQGRAVGLVLVGQSLHALDVTLRQVGFILVTGILTATLVAGLVGWALTRRALEPLDHIAALAERITGADDLSQRIAFSGPRDEVGRLAAAFDRMMGRLERAFQSQERFVADSSHELRTPLTVIRGNLDLLKRSLSPIARREALAAIMEETLRMGRIVDDLLTLAQLDSPQPIEHKPVDMANLVEEVYRQVQLLAAGKHQVTLGPIAPATILGDHDRLKQMLLNLVENALRYTPEGESVTISSRLHPPGSRLSAPGEHGRRYAERETLAVSVSDTGIGIASEDLPRLFEPFYRVDKARSRARGGTGLGLSIVQGIAQAHGGWVTVQSELGKGSTFTVWLPIFF